MGGASGLGTDEFLVPQRLGSDQLHQRVPEQIRVLAVVIPECHLIDEFYREESRHKKEALAFQSTGMADSEASRL